MPFDAFARRRIHGAMLDALRGLDWVPRSVRKLQRSVDDALTRLRHTLGREPEARGNRADARRFASSEYEGMLDDLRWTEVAVVAPVGRRRRRGLARDGDRAPTAGRYLAVRAVASCAIGWPRRIKELPERERQILALYYQEELTLAEIGQVIGVGESRVSQLRTQAIARLRSLMQEWGAAVKRPLAS